MNIKLSSLEQIRSILSSLREDPNTRRKFPQEMWNSILQLTKTYPFKEVCRQLQIHPAYLKRKMRELQNSTLEFHEISLESPPSDFISIELSSGSGLKAKIEGPLSSLKCLHQLFGG